MRLWRRASGRSVGASLLLQYLLIQPTLLLYIGCYDNVYRAPS
jgi:hypothetical protein